MPRPSARPKILEAARGCLIGGDGDFEMTDVANRAGVSEGLAYHHFGSKSGLISALVEDFYDRYSAVLNQRFDDAEHWGRREQKRMKAVIDFLVAEPMTVIVFGRLGRTPQVASLEAARVEEMIELATRNIRDGMERGHIAHNIDPEIAAAAITGAIRQTIVHAFARRPDPPADQMTTQLWAMIAGALRLDGG